MRSPSPGPDPGDSSITDYQVLRRNPAIHDPGVFGVIEDDTGSSDTSYEDTDVTPETSYVYRVKARNAHGLTGVQYTYQWVRNDGATDTDISGATAQTYTLTSDDQGNTVKVTVSFTEDDGYAETLTSAATGSVSRPANGAATGQPAITGTAQVGETLRADTSGISDANGLTRCPVHLPVGAQ